MPQGDGVIFLEFANGMKEGAIVVKLQPQTLMSDTKKLLDAFIADLIQQTRSILAEQDVSPKTDLSKSISYQWQGDMFVLLANDYYQYVSTGRKPHARKVPVEDLIQWIKDKHINYVGSINQAAFAIQQGIYKKGIAGKLYEQSVIDDATQNISGNLADGLASLIINAVGWGFYSWSNEKDDYLYVTTKVSMGTSALDLEIINNIHEGRTQATIRRPA